MIRHSTFFITLFLLIFLTHISFGQEVPFFSTESQRTTIFLENGTNTYRLNDLEVGKQYQLQITDVNYAAICMPSLTTSVYKDLIGQTDYYDLFQFVADRNTLELNFSLDCLPNDTLSKKFWATIVCQDCLPPSQARSMMGIEVEQNADAEYLIKDVFLGGNCFDVENITSKGQDVQFGVFSNATLGTGTVDHGLFNSKVDLLSNQEGIILSTGLATDAAGPNESVKTGEGVNANRGDRDLERLIGTGNMHDVVALEFDFTPTVEEVSFEYVFASEEYCEYVGSEFNDVFGFFISGPGINGSFADGAINIATLPNSNEYVSINSVNFEATREYYIKNARPGAALGCRERFGGKPVANLIEYDGLTTMLTAIARVIPCETYHIKLVIGDVSDGIFDSAVLLMANSFQAGGTVTASVNIPGVIDTASTTTALEGCQNASIVFTRTDDDTSEPLVVTYQVADSSTAIAGEDYLPFSNSVTIPRGQMTAELPIQTIDDNIEEPVEYIYLLMDQACSCEAKEVELQIAEPPAFEASFDPISTCLGGEVNLSPDLEGGIGQISYTWSTGQQSTVIQETIEQETSYTVTVSDQCNMEAEATVNITIDEPTASIEGTQKICNGERTGDIELTLSGTGPWNVTYTRDGVEQSVMQVLESPYILEDSIAGTYEIVTAEGGGCIAEGTGEAALVVSEISIDVATQNPSCFNSTDGGITTTIGGTGGDLQYEWTNGSTDKNAVDLEVGFYGLSITDDLNCLATIDSIELIAPSAITATIAADEKIDCYDLFIEAPEVEIEGGTPGHVYQIFDAVTNELVEEERIGAGTFLVKITDALGCELEESFTVNADTTRPNAAVGGKDNLSCNVLETNLSGVGSSEGRQYAYLWTTTDGNIKSDETSLTPVVDKTGTYSLIVTNLDNGCQARAFDTILGNYTMPTFSVELPDVLNCQIKEISLQGSVALPVDNYTLEWQDPIGTPISNNLTAKVEAPGSYQLIVTDEENGCADTTSVAVAQDTVAPKINLKEAFFLTCAESSVVFNTTVEGVEADEFAFSWRADTPMDEIEDRNTLELEVTQPGTYELRVNKLSNFCVSNKVVIVEMDTIAPLADAGDSFIFTCDLETANLEGETLAENSYRWTTQNGILVRDAETLTPLIGGAGQYELEVISSKNGCIATDQIQILEDPNRPEAVIAPPAALNCINERVPLDATASSQGGEFEYSWSSENGLLVNTNNPARPLASAAGTYTLQVLNTENECIGQAAVTVELDITPPVANINPSEDFDCHTTNRQLDATGSSKGDDFSYAWNTTDGAIEDGATSLFPTISQPGTYTLLITSNKNGCTEENSLEVVENVPRSLAIEKIDPPCPDETGFIQIDEVEGGIAPYRYSINGGASYQDTNAFDHISEGNYTISIMDDNDCELKDQVRIIAPPPLELEIAPEIALTLGDSIGMDVFTNIPDGEIADIIWTPAIGLSCDDCKEPMAKPLRSQTYQLRIMNVNGCEIDATTNLLVDANPNIYLPTAFSPNNADGINDRFTVFAKSSSVQFVKKLLIFDRWGNLVFERANFAPNDLELGWDGRFNNQQLAPQVFVYLAEVVMIDNRDLMFRGDVAIVE